MDHIAYVLSKSNRQLVSVDFWKSYTLSPSGLRHLMALKQLEEIDLGWWSVNILLLLLYDMTSLFLWNACFQFGFEYTWWQSLRPCQIVSEIEEDHHCVVAWRVWSRSTRGRRLLSLVRTNRFGRSQSNYSWRLLQVPTKVPTLEINGHKLLREHQRPRRSRMATQISRRMHSIQRF